jgi:2,5-diamino-6-(ribosylamino)-4(3H)-pyrimidinone 5'-phosphate reductase
MSTSLEKRIEKIQRVLDDLKFEASRGIPIVVEGKKDIETLKKLKINGEIIAAKTHGRNLLKVICEIDEQGKKEAILLMDFDRRGREWTSRLTRSLEAMKIKPNFVFWKELSSLIRKDVKDVEGLAAYIESLNKKLGKNISDILQ